MKAVKLLMDKRVTTLITIAGVLAGKLALTILNNVEPLEGEEIPDFDTIGW